MNSRDEIVRAKFFDGALSIGDLTHAAWDTAQPVKIERYWSGEFAPAARHAEARLLWNEEALFVRFVGAQNEPLIISDAPRRETKTLGLWERDVCEIFIAPDAAQPEHYFEFEVAPTGEWIDLEIFWRTDGRTTNWDYASGMQASSSVGTDERGATHVTLAMKIPFTAFGKSAPRAGESWRANLFRCVGAGRMRYLAWHPTFTAEPDFHLPQAFGDLLWAE